MTIKIGRALILICGAKNFVYDSRQGQYIPAGKSVLIGISRHSEMPHQTRC
ncbi:MAG: hypothetical protein ACOX4T_10895 [Acetivibrionales bacterium]